jgi:hypothetical protein
MNLLQALTKQELYTLYTLHFDIIAYLPRELVVNLFLFLSVKDLVTCRRVRRD